MLRVSIFALFASVLLLLPAVAFARPKNGAPFDPPKKPVSQDENGEKGPVGDTLANIQCGGTGNCHCGKRCNNDGQCQYVDETVGASLLTVL